MNDARTRLDLHARRRNGGIPTLSVLAGPPGLGASTWRRWLADRVPSPPSAVARSAGEASSVWARELTRHHDLYHRALAFVAGRSGEPALAAPAEWSGLTLSDLERRWDRLPIDAPAATLDLVLEILRRRVLGEPITGPELTAGTDDDGLAVTAALGDLVAPESWPALLVLADPADSAGRLARLVARLPRMHVALACEPEPLRAYLDEAETRTHVLVREGVIELAVVDEAGLRSRLRDEGLADGVPGPTLAYLAELGASEQLAGALVEVAGSLAAEPPAEDRARSSAERFLAEVLDTMPDTIGLFELNVPLEFRFGNAPAEADLLAEDLRIVVEIDGYFHFLGEERYRRDRRKDWLLQKHGYAVLRFLAQDVLSRLEEILATIRDAVAFRRDDTGEDRPR